MVETLLHSARIDMSVFRFVDAASSFVVNIVIALVGIIKNRKAGRFQLHQTPSL